VRSHLKNVYATLTMAVMAAATGAYVHMFTDLLQGGGILLSLVGLGLAFGKPTIYICTVTHSDSNRILSLSRIHLLFTASPSVYAVKFNKTYWKVQSKGCFR